MGAGEEKRFHQMLQVLASACDHRLDEITIALYDRALSPYGYDLVNRGLREIFESRRGGDRFPSVADIKEKMGVEIPARALAVDCANVIFWAFTHWRMDFCARDTFESDFRSKIGDLPWEVLARMGGYRAMYSEWNESADPAILRAQIRDAAQAFIDIERAGRAQNQLMGSKPKEISGNGKGK